jgi:hypothetical protein
MPGAHERHRVTTGHALGRDADRGARLPPQCGSRRVRHRNNVGRIDDANALATGMAMGKERRIDTIGRSNQQDLGIQMPRCGYRAVNHRVGRAIAAHRVNGYPNHDTPRH